MNRWTFRSYIEKGIDQIQFWYDQQIPSVQAEFFTIVSYLRDTDWSGWGRPDYAHLEGKLELLGELRVINKEGNQTVHYRILGFADEETLEFTMLAASRKTQRFSYADLGSLALRRRSNVLSKRNEHSQIARWLIE